MADTSSVWVGQTINFDNLMGGGGYDWYNVTITVGGSSYRMLHGYMVAGLLEMDAKLATAGAYASAAGGAVPAIRYAWDAGTADADPGNGEVRANNSTLSSTTELYLSTADADGADVAAIIGLFDDSTSATKGILRLAHRTDTTKWATFTVSGSVVSAVGYRKVTVAYVAGSGALSAADPVVIGFTQTGGKGDAGDAGTAASETVAGVAEIATQAEVNTGTDDGRFVTALKFATRLAAVLADYMGKIGGKFTGRVVGPDAVTLTAVSNVFTPDFSQSNSFKMTLTANSTLAFPSNPLAEQSGTFYIYENATGGYTLAIASGYVASGGLSSLSITTTANAETAIHYVVETTGRVVLSAAQRDIKA